MPKLEYDENAGGVRVTDKSSSRQSSRADDADTWRPIPLKSKQSELVEDAPQHSVQGERQQRVLDNEKTKQLEKTMLELQTPGFSDLYRSTIVIEILGMATRRLWLIFPSIALAIPLSGFRLGSLLIVAPIVYLALLMFLFCRRVLHSLNTLSNGVSLIDDARTAHQLGAREPTREERQKIINALVHISNKSKSTDIAAPDGWMVVDATMPNSYTIGNFCYVTSAAIDNQNLAGLMVHELGHVKNGDGVRMMALRNLVAPMAFFLGLDRQVTPIGSMAGGDRSPIVVKGADEKIVHRIQAWQLQLQATSELGGIGLLLNCQSWADYWRKEDLRADDYVIKLGFESELMGILEQYELFDVAQPFLMSGRPYTAERIDRLKG